jgi:HK97 family phage prohead protease
MTDKTFGTLTADLKAVKSEDPAGEFEAILSVPTVDRDGEIIDGKAFDPLPEHITIDVDHGMSTGTTVGSGEPFYDGDTLMFRGTFSTLPRAQEVRTLVTEGHIRKMSVAFMNAVREDDEDDGMTHIRSAELLNAAIVPIPSNREANILAAKMYLAAAGADRHNVGAATDADNPATAEAAEKAAAPAAAPSAAPALAQVDALVAKTALLLT